MTDNGLPVMVLATLDDESRETLDDELRRRYGGDYEIATCRSYEHARAILDGLRHWQRDVAMVLACYSPADRDGVTAVTTALGFERGARVFRVHDVFSSRAALLVAATIVNPELWQEWSPD